MTNSPSRPAVGAGCERQDLDGYSRPGGGESGELGFHDGWSADDAVQHCFVEHDVDAGRGRLAEQRLLAGGAGADAPVDAGRVEPRPGGGDRCAGVAGCLEEAGYQVGVDLDGAGL